MAIGRRMTTTTNAGHRSGQKSMAEARFARGPTANRDFYKLYSLRVYEPHNRGVPRRCDNDNLQRGVFDEQDEFCPLF